MSVPDVPGNPSPVPGPRAGGRSWLGVVNAILGVTLVTLAVGSWLRSGGDAPPPSRPAPAPVVATASAPVPSAPAALRQETPAAPATEVQLAAAESEALPAPSEARPLAVTCDHLEVPARRPAGPEPRRAYASCLVRLGAESFQAQRPAAAVRHFEDAVRVYPEGRELWAGLARVQAGAGQLDRAQAVLDEALGLFPDDSDLGLLRAEALERQGRTGPAAEALRALLARHPGQARASALLAALEKEQRVEARYEEATSQHFLVRYEGPREFGVAHAVSEALEDAYRSLGRDLDAYPPFPVQVGVYRAEVLGQLTGLAPHQLSGTFDGRKIRLNLAAATPHSPDLARLVRHEYAHVLIHQVTRGRAPAWVHEGLAQVLEPRRAPSRLADGAAPSLLTLTGLGRLSTRMDPETYVAGYQLAHAAVEHLVDRGGLSAARDFLQRLGTGQPVAEAIQAAFGAGPSEIEARLRAVAGRG